MLTILLLLQTIGRTYTATPLDSVPLSTHSYVRVVVKVDSIAKLSSGTVRLRGHAGDDSLTVDCVKGVSFCPPIVKHAVVVIFGKRYKSSLIGWEIRPVEGVQIATPGTYASCRVGGVRRRCWLGLQELDDAPQ